MPQNLCLRLHAGLGDGAFDRLAQASWGWTWCDSLHRVDLSRCGRLSVASFEKLAMVSMATASCTCCLPLMLGVLPVAIRPV